jgi:hypothetical protein
MYPKLPLRAVNMSTYPESVAECVEADEERLNMQSEKTEGESFSTCTICRWRLLAQFQWQLRKGNSDSHRSTCLVQIATALSSNFSSRIYLWKSSNILPLFILDCTLVIDPLLRSILNCAVTQEHPQYEYIVK